MKKRIWAFILILTFAVLSATVCCADDKGVGFVAKSSAVDSNYNFTMDVVVENLGSAEIGGLNLVLRYDSRLFEVENASSKLDGAAVKDNAADAYVNFAWENSSGEIKNNSTLFTVKFKAKKKNLTGKYTMSLSCNEIYDSSENLTKIKNYTKVQDVNLSAIVKADVGNGSAYIARVVLYIVSVMIFASIITGVCIIIKANKKLKTKYKVERGKKKND